MPFLAVCGILLAMSAQADPVFHVSSTGSDANPGTNAQPFLTLKRAVSAIRGLNGARVVLAGGDYYLADTLRLGPQDSGTKEHSIVFEAAPGAKVRVSGGKRIHPSWEPFRNGIFVTPCDAKFDQLFVNGKRQILARYPNFDPTKRPFGGVAKDALSPDRIKGWIKPVEPFVHALHSAEWGDFHYRITGIGPDGKPTLEGGCQNNRRMGMADAQMVENVFEELDSPGEWYLDSSDHKLYYYPVAGLDLDKAVVETSGLNHLIEFRGSAEKPVKNVRFQGITFTGTARTFMLTKEPLLRSDWCIYRGGAILFEGAEDCEIRNCDFDQVGGNAVFVSNYNRGIRISGCRIEDAGASGICFVGSPGAVRSPSFEYGESVPMDKMDLTPGPRSKDYPAQCVAHDNLIARIGVFEKQAAGVEISMAEEITVSHNSIYEVPRAGINIGDGCWGGHVIEFNDVFDTVLETGDHGSFNSWGRDRFWLPDIGAVNKLVAANPALPLLDCRKTITLRNNRWRCDHGWDIDLDDGSTNYIIENNLCLNGGIKNREGYGRVNRNNIIINNGFHPHVWFTDSGDSFVRNIVVGGYAPIGMPVKWGKETDHNLFAFGDLSESQKAGRDLHSVVADPQFVNPSFGDFRVKNSSPALKLGFKNFPMDKFGVVSPRLKALARTPVIPTLQIPSVTASSPIVDWLGAKVKNLEGLGERSATGMASETGVLVLEVPAGSVAATFGLRAQDVILALGDRKVRRVTDLLDAYDKLPPGVTVWTVYRAQKERALKVTKQR